MTKLNYSISRAHDLCGQLNDLSTFLNASVCPAHVRSDLIQLQFDLIEEISSILHFHSLPSPDKSKLDFEF